MIKLSILVLYCFIFFVNVNAQTKRIAGIVRDADSEEPLVGASVFLKNSNRGVATDLDGKFFIARLNDTSYVLVISLIGYVEYETIIDFSKNDSLFLTISLEPSEVEAEEMVITGTRTTRSIADVPVRVEAIPQEEVEEKLMMTPSNVAMLLNESTGMRVQTTSATSNTANLRIQGLSGRYTQLLTDGIPNFGGLSSGFGLTQLPPLNLRQVEVVKGAASALYGPDAISGIVNFITKEPKDHAEFTSLLNITTQKGLDAAGFFSQRFNQMGITLLFSRNTQEQFDVDHDNYADVAGFTRISLTPKITFKISENLDTKISLGYSSEDRTGGVMNVTGTTTNATSPYLETIHTERRDISSHTTYELSTTQSFVLKLAGTSLSRDANYGINPFNATQSMLYADAQYSTPWNSQSLLFGVAFSYDRFEDRTPNYSSLRNYEYHSPALFAQDEIPLNHFFTFVASGRIDFHNRFGTFLTPRVSLMYKPSPAMTLRLGGGTGFKSPTIFIEDVEEAGFVNLRPLHDVTTERSQSCSFDINWNTFIGKFGVTLNTAFYLTNLESALLVDDDSLTNNVLFVRNATGSTLSRGGEISLKFVYDDFKLSLGYTYLYSSQEDKGITQEVALNPRHSLGAILFWENHESLTKIGLENYWTGVQRLDHHPQRTHSPAYWITGLIVEKGFGIVRVFVNFENIFDTRQTRYEPIYSGNPFTGNFIPVPIYAPLEGRAINGGIRVVM